MNNNNLHNKNSAIFIAAVLVAGVFAISSPLTVYGQQYEQDYQQDYDSSYYQSDPRIDDRSQSIKPSQKANCDNKNINVNDINQIQRQNQAVGNTIGTAAALNGESLTGEEALNALTGNDDPLANIDRNIVNICINSNDNTLTGTFTATQTQTPTEPQTCEECFELFLSRAQIEEFLNLFGTDISLGQICASFEMNGAESETEFISDLERLLDLEHDDAVALVECLKNAGIDFRDAPV